MNDGLILGQSFAQDLQLMVLMADVKYMATHSQVEFSFNILKKLSCGSLNYFFSCDMHRHGFFFATIVNFFALC